MNFLLQILFITLWDYLYKYLQEKTKHNEKYSKDYKKLSRNFISLIHSSVVVIGTIYFRQNALITTIKYISSSYFIYDTVHTITDKKNWNDRMNLGLIFHHVICITSLDYYDIEPYQSYFVEIFLYSEISNILLYIVYTLLHTTEDKNNNTIFTLQLFQTCLYIYFRGYVLLYIGYNCCIDQNTSNMVYLLWTVYVLGLIWGYKLITQTLNNIKLKMYGTKQQIIKKKE